MTEIIHVATAVEAFSVLRSRSVPVPVRMSKMPRDRRGFTVPFFVSWLDANGNLVDAPNGTPDFRVIDTRRFAECVNFAKCWLCGEKLGRYKAYVVGPMCAVNRTTSEPPCHRECAVYALQVCPFLAQPKMRRNEKNMPDGYIAPAGEGLKRNPGMGVLWLQDCFAKRYDVEANRLQNINGGYLFQLQDPVEVQWWKDGRPATREEAEEALKHGAPAIREIAVAEGHGAIEAFDRMYDKARRYLPVHA